VELGNSGTGSLNREWTVRPAFSSVAAIPVQATGSDTNPIPRTTCSKHGKRLKYMYDCHVSGELPKSMSKIINVNIKWSTFSFMTTATVRKLNNEIMSRAIVSHNGSLDELGPSIFSFVHAIAT
jgi:hypothetical protein